jgi:hypothetical protein
LKRRTASGSKTVVIVNAFTAEKKAGARAMMRRPKTDREDRQMCTSIRKYNVRRGSAEKLAQSVREGFVPMVRQMPGFRGYYLLDGGPDVLIPSVCSTARMRLLPPMRRRRIG